MSAAETVSISVLRTILIIRVSPTFPDIVFGVRVNVGPDTVASERVSLEFLIKNTPTTTAKLIMLNNMKDNIGSFFFFFTYLNVEFASQSMF